MQFHDPPDHLEDIGVCDIGPVTITPAGGGIPQIKPAADLFFSEYVEGSLNNKCLEIYNGTPDTVDLDAEHYRVSIYFNGDTNLLTQGIIDLTGKIPRTGLLFCATIWLACPPLLMHQINYHPILILMVTILSSSPMMEF